MVALSIRQPWASLIVAGIKDVENRTWQTAHRGPLLIHAGRRDDAGLSAYDWHRLLALLGRRRDELPRGGIIGSAVLVECVSSSQSRWFTGPYGFVLEKAQPCSFRPARGRLHLFRPEDAPEPACKRE